MAITNPKNDITQTASGATSTFTQSLTRTPLAGDLLIASCKLNMGASSTNPAITCTNFTDSGEATVQVSNASPFEWTQLAYKVAVGNETSVKFNFTGTAGAPSLFWVSQFTGFLGTPTLDLHKSTATSGSAVTTINSNTTNQQVLANELAYSTLGLLGSVSSFTNASCWYGKAAATTFQFTQIAVDPNLRGRAGWCLPTASQSTNEWLWTWVLTGGTKAGMIGVTFYDLVPATTSHLLASMGVGT